METEIEAGAGTIKKVIKRLHYKKCSTCKGSCENQKTAESCLAFAKCMLGRYKDKDNWKHVCFSNKVHFGWGWGSQCTL